MSYLAPAHPYARFCAARSKANPTICIECGEPLWDEEAAVQRTGFCFVCLEDQGSPEARKAYLKWWRHERKMFGQTSALLPIALTSL